MPSSAKPRKKYRPRDVVRPLNVRNAWASEGDVHAALLAMEAGQAEEDHLAMLCAHAHVMQRLALDESPERRQADTILRMVGIILRRPDHRITPAEEIPIRAALQVTLPALQRAKNHDLLRAATASLKDQDRWGGVRL